MPDHTQWVSDVVVMRLRYNDVDVQVRICSRGRGVGSTGSGSAGGGLATGRVGTSNGGSDVVVQVRIRSRGVGSTGNGSTGGGLASGGCRVNGQRFGQAGAGSVSRVGIDRILCPGVGSTDRGSTVIGPRVELGSTGSRVRASGRRTGVLR